MSTDKTPAAPNTAPLDLAVADVRDTAATLRDTVARAEAVAGRLEHIVGAGAVLLADIAEYGRAQRALLDVTGVLAAAAEQAPLLLTRIGVDSGPSENGQDATGQGGEPS
jgi:hypothetical protein